MRTIVGNKDGFIVTWIQRKTHDQNHKWWHCFFVTTQPIIENGLIKTASYIKKRVWLTSCKKCSFFKVEARELWMPGEKIPKGGISLSGGEL